MQADNDHHVKDTYNYVTVQADIKMPGRHLAYLADSRRHAAYESAIKAAVAGLDADDRDVRVLNLGCGAGMWHLACTSLSQDAILRASTADVCPTPAAELLQWCCAGLHALMALRAGAKHVTAVDRWLYMASACKETLVGFMHAGFHDSTSPFCTCRLSFPSLS